MKRAARQYNFGIGKRNALQEKLVEYLLQNSQNAPKDAYVDGPIFALEPYAIKRNKPQRFSFGLGKRAEEVLDDNSDEMSVEEADSRLKRKADRYSFGLGKRSPLVSSWFGISSSGGPKSARAIDEFKRRYNFGLGK